VDGQDEGTSGGGTLMTPVTRYGNGEGGRQWCATIFGGEEGEEARRLHGAGGRRHNEELRGDQGGRRW
jgi:hypothetical protein